MNQRQSQYLGEGWSAEEARTFVGSCYERDALLTVMLHFGASAMRGRAVCLVSNEDVTPYLSAGWVGEEESDSEMGAIDLPIEGNEALGRLALSSEPRRASPRELGLGGLFVRSLIPAPGELATFPLSLGGRTRVLLIGEPLLDRGAELGQAWAIAQAVADQLETIIKLAKSRSLPPRAERIPELPERFRLPEEDEPALEAPRESEPKSGARSPKPDDAYPELSEPGAEAATSGGGQFEPRRTIQLDLDGESQTADFDAISDDDSPGRAPPSAGEALDFDEEIGREGTAPAAGPKSDPSRASARSRPDPGISASGPSITASGGMRSIGDEPTDERTRSAKPLDVDEPASIPEISIVEPIEVGERDSEAKTTLMGGYSLDDIRRAQSLYTEEEPYSKTMLGVSMPQAKIIRPRGARTQEKKSRFDSTARPLSGVSSHASGSPSSARRARELGTSASDEATSTETFGRVPTREFVSQGGASAESASASTPQRDEARSLSARGDLSAAPGLGAESASAARAEPGGARRPWGDGADPPPEGIAIDGSTFPARVMPALGPPAWSSVPGDQREAIADLFGASRREAFEAAERIAPTPAVLDRVRREFPGRLYVDRYQHSDRDLPPVERHGPLLAAAARFGAEAAPIAAAMLEESSLDVRFYATFLFTSLSPLGHLPALGRRLFDRDLQTRRVARAVLFSVRDEPEFEPIARSIRARLASDDEAQIHAAASLAGDLRDARSIESLIECLAHTSGRVKAEVHKALQRICLQALPPSAPLWRAWYGHAREQKRSTWLVIGMNHEAAFVRRFAAEELREIGAELSDYSPDQPAHLRAAAQERVRDWLRRDSKHA